MDVEVEDEVCKAEAAAQGPASSAEEDPPSRLCPLCREPVAGSRDARKEHLGWFIY